MKKAKAVMLGGSNTVLSGAFRDGISESFMVSSFAVGASSSIQNLAALLENSKEIEDANMVFTESNVNDTHILQNTSLAISRIIEQINDYYKILASLNNNVVVVIYPQAGSSFQGRENLENVEKVNKAHKLLASQLKFKVIDLYAECKRLDSRDAGLLIPDPRHINQAFMYNLGRSCGVHFRHDKYSSARSSSGVSLDRTNDYVLITPAELGTDLETKKNSLFEKTCLRVSADKAVVIPAHFNGMYIVGVGTWSDSYSALIIGPSDEVIKPFNALNAFNEIANPVKVTELTYLKSALDSNGLTELSNNVKKEKVQSNVKITSLLLRKKLFDLDFELKTEECEKLDSLNHLIPKFEPYIKATSFLITKKPLEYFIDHKLDGVKGKRLFNLAASILKVLAVKILKSDKELATDIMKLALRLNPEARAITKWLNREEGRDDLV